MKRTAVFAALFLIALNLCPGESSAAAAERILGFHSLVRVGADGSVTVEETIRVAASGAKIKRGIYRDFPTHYKDRFGNRVTVGFEVIDVRRDGAREPYHIKKRTKGVRVYIGRKDVLLEPGDYTYTLTYRTDRQIGFFEEFDELYWNVTGNDWEFPIEEASAEVHLPPGADVLELSAYTGPKGARGRDFAASRGEGVVRVTTTKSLAPGEGLTVAVSWPKGFVPEPGPGEKAAALLKENRSALAALAGLFFVILYFAIAWLKVGRDPARGTIVPQYEPPDGLSPAAVRYLMGMGYSDRVFAAAAVNMAVKNYLTIEADGSDFTLHRAEADESVLTSGEKRIARKLFSDRESIELHRKYNPKIRDAVTSLKKGLRAEFEKTHFVLNARWILPGALLSVATLASVVVAAEERAPAAFLSVWLSVWTFACYGLLLRILKALRAGRSALGGASGWTAGQAAAGGAAGCTGCFSTLFALPFFAGEIAGLSFFAAVTSPFAALLLLLIVGVNLLFYQIMKAPTLKGRRLMDRIEGFRSFLEATGQDRMDRLTPPERTPALFERYLPYALALEVENRWCEQFTDILARSAEGGEYRPGWYSGGRPGSFSPAVMASSLGASLASAVSSSASPPGSSSGSGGGGSSGGGGGGGGGGGW